jgi:hypothetical protein
MDGFSTELGIRLNFVKTSEFLGGFEPPKPALGTPLLKITALPTILYRKHTVR